MPYLSSRALGGLKQYEYKSGGYTWLDDLHQPFWTWSTEQLPLWLAPNLITLTGLTGLLFAYVVAFIYLPGFEGHAPTWVYFCGGTAAFAYLHLDCIDGKQARRTKSSSPLGQLFDHGCDALAVHLLLATVACSLNLGGTWKAVAGSMLIMVPWGYAHWEEYHDGTMLYGNGVWGITEALYALIILHFVTCWAGPEVWLHDLQHVVPRLPFHLKANDALLLLVFFCACQQLGGQTWRTLFTPPSVRLQGKDAGHKQLGYGHAANHYLQLALVMVVGVFSMLEAIRHQCPYHGRAVAASFGIVYALQSTRLIMAHMTKEPFKIAPWAVILLVLGIVNDRLEIFNIVAVAWIILGLLIFGYLHYVIKVIGQICGALNIHCLTIKRSTE